jgi:hypothetical protein
MDWAGEFVGLDRWLRMGLNWWLRLQGQCRLSRAVQGWLAWTAAAGCASQPLQLHFSIFSASLASFAWQSHQRINRLGGLGRQVFLLLLWAGPFAPLSLLPKDGNKTV